MEKDFTPEIIVTSTSPHRMCAGVAFTGAMSFPLDRFNKAELGALVSDRMLTVVVGKRLLLDDIDDFVATLAPEKAEKPGKAAKAS